MGCPKCRISYVSNEYTYIEYMLLRNGCQTRIGRLGLTNCPTAQRMLFLAFENRELKVVEALVHEETDDQDLADTSLFYIIAYFFTADLGGKGFVSGLQGLGCVNPTTGILKYVQPEFLKLFLFILTNYSSYTEILNLSSGIGSRLTTRHTAYSSEMGIYWYEAKIP